MFHTIQDLFFFPGFCLWVLTAVYVIGKAAWYFIDSKSDEYAGDKLAYYDLGKVLRLNKGAMKTIEEEFIFIGELALLVVFLFAHAVLSLIWPVYIIIVGVLAAKIYRLNIKEKNSE